LAAASTPCRHDARPTFPGAGAGGGDRQVEVDVRAHAEDDVLDDDRARIVQQPERLAPAAWPGPVPPPRVVRLAVAAAEQRVEPVDRTSTRLNSSHVKLS